MVPWRLPDGPLRIVCLGAHCDDIEIGAGATVMRLLADHPGSAIDWVVLASDEVRRAEAIAASADFCVDAASLNQRIGSLPENLLPWEGPAIKALLADVAAGAHHDLVLCPALHDRHQDHRILAEAAHQTWRDHLLWSYEIAKWEGDLRTPDLYVRLTDDLTSRKLDLLDRHFASQHARGWYDREAFSGLMRLRGVECNHRYAEGFHVLKSAL